MEKTRITVAEASKLLGITQMALRIALRQGRFSQFGEAWKNDEKWSYYVNRARLEQYLNAGDVNDELKVKAEQSKIQD
ncbi:MAG TPA: hypothetical protein DIV40_05995 [Clostridiales bacterium]|nr:hypothetical protein [Clostridiales bacterium]